MPSYSGVEGGFVSNCEVEIFNVNSYINFSYP